MVIERVMARSIPIGTYYTRSDSLASASFTRDQWMRTVTMKELWECSRSPSGNNGKRNYMALIAPSQWNRGGKTQRTRHFTLPTTTIGSATQKKDCKEARFLACSALVILVETTRNLKTPVNMTRTLHPSAKTIRLPIHNAYSEAVQEKVHVSRLDIAFQSHLSGMAKCIRR
jgi:hypothetical protein